MSNVAEAVWLGAVLDRLPEQGFRVASPRRASTGSWVVDGWAASAWMGGAHQYNRWSDAVRACRALSKALSVVERPDFLADRRTVWDAGDQAAWAAEPPAVDHPELWPLVSAFSALRRPCHDPDQVIHGDLTGNILYPEHGDPVIIDFAIYWRPAAFAEAIIVADALAFHDAPAELAAEISSQPRSMLARACLYRLITSDVYASTAAVNDTYLPLQVESFTRVLAICEGLPPGD